MDANSYLFGIKISLIFVFCFLVHFLIMFKRQALYVIACKFVKRRIRFFEGADLDNTVYPGWQNESKALSFNGKTARSSD